MQGYEIGDRIIYHGEPKWKNPYQKISDFPGWVTRVCKNHIVCNVPYMGIMRLREGDSFEKVERPWINYKIERGSKTKQYRCHSKEQGIYFTEDRNDTHIIKWINRKEAVLVATRLNVQPDLYGIGSEEL